MCKRAWVCVACIKNLHNMLWEKGEGRSSSPLNTHKLSPELGLDTLSLCLWGMDGVAEGAQVVVHRQAFPHVEGPRTEVAERSLIHGSAELWTEGRVPHRVHTVVFQSPGLTCGEGERNPASGKEQKSGRCCVPTAQQIFSLPHWWTRACRLQAKSRQGEGSACGLCSAYVPCRAHIRSKMGHMPWAIPYVWQQFPNSDRLCTTN